MVAEVQQQIEDAFSAYAVFPKLESSMRTDETLPELDEKDLEKQSTDFEVRLQELRKVL